MSLLSTVQTLLAHNKA